MQIRLTIKQIHAFLHFGYVPDTRRVNLDKMLARYGVHLHSEKDNVPEEMLIDKGVAILDEVLRDIAQRIGDRSVLIPISGGMDSRAILAGILKHLPAAQIRTVTIGIPGALDYEIGQMVAKKAGVRNSAINLNHIDWDEKELLQYAKKFYRAIPLIEGFLFSQIFRNAFSEDIILNGFMGDPLSGSHLSNNPSTDWNEALKNFCECNNYTKEGESVSNSFLTILPNKLLCDDRMLSLEEQLDFFIRQRFYIKPLVMLNGYNIIVPFLDPRWIEFSLNLQHSMRKKQYLYKKILYKAYPDLFSLPLKIFNGLPMNASRFCIACKGSVMRFYRMGRKYAPVLFKKPSSHLNYIDFETKYRSNSALRDLAEKNLAELQKRNIINHINIEKVWREHQERKKNHARLITLLVSLEIFLKANMSGVDNEQ